MEYRTLNLGKLRRALPDAWHGKLKTRFMREIREECNIYTALHEVGTNLMQHALDLALDNFLCTHGYLLEVEAIPPQAAHLEGMPNIRMSFSLQHPPLQQAPPINRDSLVFTMAAVAGGPPMSPLSDAHGRACVQALQQVVGIGNAQQPGYMSRVWESIVRPRIQDENSGLWKFVHMARRGRDRRNKAYGNSIIEHLGPTLQANMKAMIAHKTDMTITVCVQDLARSFLPLLPEAARKVLVDRTAAFMSPRHIKLAEVHNQGQPVLPLDLHHPMFLHLPQLGLPLRQVWIDLLRPMHTLLAYALHPQFPRVQNLPIHPPPNNLVTSSQIRNDAGSYMQWRQMVGDARIAERCLPFLRYASRLHRDLSILPDGNLPPGYRALTVFPCKTSFRTEMVPFNARTMASTIVVSLTRPWEGMRVFEGGQLTCARELDGFGMPIIQNTTEYAQREIWRTLFPGLFKLQMGNPPLGGAPNERNQHVAKSPLRSPHRVRLRGLNLDIYKAFIRTDGVSIQFIYKLSEDVPAWAAQSRIASPETVRFLSQHQVLPNPELFYPGTMSKGSLSSLSRLPILPAAIALEQGRPLIGIDPGQANHVTAIIQEPREAYEALIEGMGAEEAKDAFKDRLRQVKGRHSNERTLTRRSERMEARKRALDHANTPNGETSVQDAIEILRGLQAVTIGTDVVAAAEYLETRNVHWSKLHRFWNKNQVLTKQRFLHRATEQSYSTKVSRFVSWKITQEEFLNEGQSIVVKHSRQTSRKTEWRRTRRAHFQRPPPGMEPIIAFGWGQSNRWQNGHTSASQTTLAQQMAIDGATVLLVNERMTSKMCSANLPVLAMDPPAQEDYHQCHDLQIRAPRCTAQHHVKKKMRMPGHGHRKAEFCLTGGAPPLLTSGHAPLQMHWSPYYRLKCCTSEMCNVHGAPNQALLNPNRLQIEVPANAPLILQSRVLDRDVNAAANMRFIAKHYFSFTGRLPIWNESAEHAAQVLPGLWENYVAPDPAEPHQFARAYIAGAH